MAKSNKKYMKFLQIVKKITKHLSKYMLIYSIITILIGLYVSCKYSPKFLSKYIPIIVFLMIYPMMVNVSFESLKKVNKYSKSVLLALFYNFVLAPSLYLVLCKAFGVSYDIKIALLLLAVAPASSMGIGYVGLAEGNVTLASMIVAVAFIMSLVVYPSVLYLLNIGYQLVPFDRIVKHLIILLVLPLILGVFTREILIEKKGINFQEVKPVFSLITLVFLYILIFTIFATKGVVILKHPHKLFLVLSISALFYFIMLVVEYFINRYLVKLNYAEHQAIVFTTVSKNVALTIGLLSVAFGEMGRILAMYPAMISITQLLFLVTYLQFSLNKLREYSH